MAREKIPSSGEDERRGGTAIQARAGTREREREREMSGRRVRSDGKSVSNLDIEVGDGGMSLPWERRREGRI